MTPHVGLIGLLALLILGQVTVLRADAPGVPFKPRSGRQVGVVQTNPIKSTQISEILFQLNGWGLAVRDLNEDGWPDMVLGGKPGWGGLYYSDGRPWHFTNADLQLPNRLQSATIAGILISDLDRDGHLDLVASTYDSGIHVNHGQGRGGFKPGGSTYQPPKGVYWGGMAAADIDQNGTVDIVAMGYRQNRSRSYNALRSAGGSERRLTTPTPSGAGEGDTDRFRVSKTGLVAEMGAASVVLLNQAGTHLSLQEFSTVADYGHSGDKGLELDWSLSCAFQDINGDGLPDLYVCNDYHSPDRLWINAGGGRFTNQIDDHLPLTSLFSMGVAFSDLNRDGVPDWIVTDMLPQSPSQRILEYDDIYLHEKPSELFGSRRQISRNTLFVSGPSRGQWNEVGCLRGVAASGWSWGPVWLDLNGDGLIDLLIPSGYAQNLQDQSKPRGISLTDFYSTRENGVFAYVQTPDGRFQERSKALGLDLARSITMAVIPCDLDHDGDADLIVHNFAEPIQFFENTTDQRFVCVSLAAGPGGQPLEGTRIRWKEGTRAVSSTWFGGGTYLSSAPPEFYAPLADRASAVRLEVVWPDGQSEEHTLRAGWHRIPAPPSSGRLAHRLSPNPEARPISRAFQKSQELALPGTTGDHHDDLTLQAYLPLSLNPRRLIHTTRDSRVWLADSGGGSLIQLEPTQGAPTHWGAEIVLKRTSPPPVCFLPERAIGWLENTYRFGAGQASGVYRLAANSRIEGVATIPENGLVFAVGPETGPWLLGGAARFGQFPDHPSAMVWEPGAGKGTRLTQLPFESRISDGLWVDSGDGGTWLLAEWFGQAWHCTGHPESSPWMPVSDPQRPGPVGHIQTALFSGAGSQGLGRDEVVIAGYGLNNEWVFRANDHLGWLLLQSTNETSFSGLIEFMMDDDGVAQPLIPFKHFKLNPDVEPFANGVDYSTARGQRLHRDIGQVKRVDTANAMLRKQPSGHWERRPLPLALQVAPIQAAVVIPTPEGPAWLITFKETDGHRIFGSPAQRWPAMVYWPSATGSGGHCVPAADLGFVDLTGDAELVITGKSPRSVQVLAFWKEGRRCSIYSAAGR